MHDDDGQMEAAADNRTLGSWLEDVRASLMFLSRFPIPSHSGTAIKPLGHAVRGFPVAGACVGASAGIVLLACQLLGVPDVITALITVAAGIAITGALHEDGLADVADGFAGGATMEARLSIMRDSQIGAFGALALVLAVGLKTAAMVELLGSSLTNLAVIAVVVAAAAMSRGYIAAIMQSLAPVRSDGRSAEAGQPSKRASNEALLVGLGVGAICLLWAGGFWLTVLPIAISYMAYTGFKAWCRRKIGGQTGDVLGATQLITETAILIVAATIIG